MSAGVMKLEAKEAYSILGLRCNTSEAYAETQKKKLWSKLA
jgi:hypothetical protein